MTKRKLKNGGCRPKAFLGLDTSAAILAAAGIGAATQLTAAGINAKAAKDSAKESANATLTAAKNQAAAIKEQTQKSNEAQLQSQEFVKEQNEQNREIQRDIQVQLQLMNGQQNVTDRLEASKIQVKNGGSTKRKLRLAGKSQYLLRGSENMPFVVTDGGTVIPIGQTPEGYDMYEILGNDHEHYHKAQGGKNKTGVGIKFADGNVIEGEGNQNTNQGEIMVNTPDNTYFISKHSIAGFNPAKMTLGGMHPLRAYAIQEQLKAANGISDDGKHNSTPVEKMYIGGTINPIYFLNDTIMPNESNDISGATSVGVANGKRLLRLGGCSRRKALGGASLYQWPTITFGNNFSEPIIPYAADYNGMVKMPDLKAIPAAKITVNDTNPLIGKPITTSYVGNSSSQPSKFSQFVNNNADLIGAGITGLGNIGGALITAGATRSAGRHLARANQAAADILANAYRNLKTIDANSIKREDYRSSHVMPYIQAPISFAASNIAGVDRALQRRLANAGKYSASGAAGLARMAKAEVDAQDMRNRVYSADQEQMQNIRQQNAQRITEASMRNAELDTQANRDYTTAMLNLLQYNNDIENERILGEANALSEGTLGAAQARADARTQVGNIWGNTLINTAQGFANSFTNAATRRADLEKVLLGAGSDARASYYANRRLTSYNDAANEYNRLKTQYDRAISNGDTNTANMIARQINNIASARGLRLV